MRWEDAGGDRCRSSISSLQDGGEMSGISVQIGSKVRAKKLIVNYGIPHPQKKS
jgi:hypothetical protein